MASRFDPKLPALLIAGSMTTMAGGVIAPVLPEMVHQLQLNPTLAANLVSFHCLTIALFSPLLGILADRTGRLRVLVLSLVLYAIVGVSGAFMHDIGPLLVSRGLIGAASGGIVAASLGLLTSLYEGDARTQALGYATTTLTITGILYPLLGGWVGAHHWQYTFLLYAIALPLAVIASVVLRQMPTRSPSAPAAHAAPGRLRLVLRQPQVLWLLLLLALASVVMYAVVIYAPMYLRTAIGAGAALNGIVLAARAIGAAIVSAVGTKFLVKRLGRPRTIALGFTLMAITVATIPLLDHLTWILVTAILFGTGFGIVLPSLYSKLTDLAPANVRSSVLAAGTGAGFLGQFLSPVLLAPALSYGGLSSVFYAAAVMAIVGAGVFWMTTAKEP